MKTTTALDTIATLRQVHTTHVQAYLHLLSEYMNSPRLYARLMSDECLVNSFFIPEIKQKETFLYLKPFISDIHKAMSVYIYHQHLYPRLELLMEEVIDIDEYSMVGYIRSNLTQNQLRLLFEFDKKTHKIIKINTFHLK